MKHLMIIAWILASVFAAGAEDFSLATGFGIGMQSGVSSFSLYPAAKITLDWEQKPFIISSSITSGQLLGGVIDLSFQGLYSYSINDKWSMAAGPYLGGGYSDFVLHFDSSETPFIPHHFQVSTGFILRPLCFEWESFSMQVLNIKMGTSLVDFFQLTNLDVELINFGVSL